VVVIQHSTRARRWQSLILALRSAGLAAAALGHATHAIVAMDRRAMEVVMPMKQHILAALREEFDAWEALLGGLGEAQITAPQLPASWSIKDDVAHLWRWQQRSIARLDAARLGRDPEYPDWPAGLDPESAGATDQINDWMRESSQGQPWALVHQEWRAGYIRFLEGAAAIAERDLLDSSRYAWLDGYPLACVLLASYDHHHEHYEQTLAWLHGERQ
jgi:Protein of unknown function (DUF1706)